MPWKECSVMDERLRFVAQLLDGEAMIEGARTGKFVPAVETEAPGPLQPLVPSCQVRGIHTAASETTFPKLIEEWARKKRIDNPQTRSQRETHFQALAEFLGHDN
jgi:hypothetical protein